MLILTPFHEDQLRFLVPLLPKGQDQASLRQDLTDFARGGGTQVVVVMDGDRVGGAAGWVTFGVAAEGILYGGPVLAGSQEAARLLLEHLIGTARELGAQQLRVSLFPREEAKAKAMEELGFLALLDLITVARSSSGLPLAAMPERLVRVPFQAVDWSRFAKASNAVFEGVPNAPPVNAEQLRQEWEAMDPEASQLWQDEAGNYMAWSGVHPDGYVDAIGVEASLRGRGVGVALYHLAAETLAARAVPRLHALVASTNQATLRLHEKLGFREFTRRTVFTLDL